jgi:hypothetical protein
MILEFLYGMVCLVMLLVCVYGRGEVKRFLESTPRIEDEASLERFKVLARKNMYLALFQGLMFLPLMLAVIVFTIRHGLAGFCIVLGVNGLLFGFGRSLMVLEVRARNLDAAERLQGSYQHAAQSWVKKALPDF